MRTERLRRDIHLAHGGLRVKFQVASRKQFYSNVQAAFGEYL